MIVAIIIVLAIAFVLLTLTLVKQRKSDPDRDQQNIDILRQEFVDLKAQLDAGEVTQDQYQQLYDELVVALGTDLHQNAPAGAPRFHLSQRATLIGVFVLLAVLTPSLYFMLGSPQALNPQTAASTDTAQANGNMHSIEAMIDKLKQKLEQEPNNTEGWLMLGRSYMVLKQYDQAVDALTKAYALNSSDTGVMLFYADAITMQNGGQINEKAFKLINMALTKSPQDPTALWMAAMAYESKGDYKKAVGFWQSLLPKVQSNANDYQEVKMRLAHAEARLSGKPLELPGATQVAQASGNAGDGANSGTPAAASTASVTAVIKLDQKYKQRVNPTDTVFVFARAVNGPRQPLAAKRLQVKDLPATITLDDSMAMSPMNKLSDYAQVFIGARISRSGNVMPSSGDLQGQSGAVKTKTPGQTIEITIDQEVM
jgi:cytochrome c-type biogenesis protein CcmH